MTNESDLYVDPNYYKLLGHKDAPFIAVVATPSQVSEHLIKLGYNVIHVAGADLLMSDAQAIVEACSDTAKNVPVALVTVHPLVIDYVKPDAVRVLGALKQVRCLRDDEWYVVKSDWDVGVMTMFDILYARGFVVAEAAESMDEKESIFEKLRSADVLCRHEVGFRGQQCKDWFEKSKHEEIVCQKRSDFDEIVAERKAEK